MSVIECQAAIAWKPDPECKLTVQNIFVDPPKKGEVRVKIIATGVCHTDAYTLSGKDPEVQADDFPVVLGHEGAGIVESVGEGVTDFKEGDRVIPLYIPQCKNCKFCKNPKTNLCQAVRATQGKGLMPDGTKRFKAKHPETGEMHEVAHFMGCSAFSEYTVVAAISLCKVPDEGDCPLDKVCLLGCGISTGFGAPINTVTVEEGSNVAIWGLGAVGLAVAMGARHQKAARIIGIDLNESKFELAKTFGCNEFVNPKTLPKEKSIVQHLHEITDGGLDYTFECVGNIHTMRQALEACHKGWGESVIIGVAASGQEISTRPFQLVVGRVWRGCAFGGWKSVDSVPKLCTMYSNKELMIDEFVTHKMTLDKINESFELMHQGKSLRAIVYFHEEDMK